MKWKREYPASARSPRDPAAPRSRGPSSPSHRADAQDAGHPASARERAGAKNSPGLRWLLALRAEVALAELVGVEADVDQSPALIAREATALLNRAQLAAVEHKARTPRPTVAIAPQEVPCGENDATQLGVVEVRDLRPRPRVREEERLVLDLVPDPRKRALVEERRRDLTVGLCAQPT